MEKALKLTAEEQIALERVYGRQTFDSINYNPRRLEAVKELTAEEKKFFAGKNFVSSHFFVQTIYKVQGSVSPLKFTVTVNRFLNENEGLRANFCNLGKRTVKAIHPKDVVKPEILFRNLIGVSEDEFNGEMEKYFIAEIRREVSLERDPLIRFAIYRTGLEEFALVVTMAQIISVHFDAEKFFTMLWGLSAETEPKKVPKKLPPKKFDLIRGYWSKIFDKTPPPAALPYEKKSDKPYRQKILQEIISSDLVSDLMGYAKGNKMMLMAILQSAWGFMLQITNKRRDCLFCQISPAEDFSLNVIPVRLTIDDADLTVEQIIRNQFRQLIISQPFSIADWTALDELTVQKKLFEHFIVFKEFTSGESDYANYPEAPAEPLGKVIFQSTWDAQDMKLGAYFRYSSQNMILGFVYDAEQFWESGVEKLYRLYEFILKHIVDDWSEKFSAFMNRINERVGVQLETEVVPPENEELLVRDFLSQLPILQGRFEGTLAFFASKSKLIVHYEGDRISDDILKQNFVFVVSGLFSRNVDTGDGWYNTLDIIDKNAFLNPTNLLEKPRYKVSATVLTNQAECLMIPRDVFMEVLGKNPEIALSIMNYALKQMELWQTIWLQS